MLASVWNACVSVQCRSNSKHPRSTGLVPSRSGVFTHFLGKGFLTLPMPKGRGFLVQRPLRRLRGIGVLHDLPKREFPCAPRYVLFPFMQLWICLPKPCAGCSLRRSHLCRDGFRTLGNPIRGHSNPLSVGYDSHKPSMFDSTGRMYRP